MMCGSGITVARGNWLGSELESYQTGVRLSTYLIGLQKVADHLLLHLPNACML